MNGILNRIDKFLIVEKWVTSRKNRFEVLVIPPDRAKDLHNLEAEEDEIRFTADNTFGTLYVWDAYMATHQMVWNKIISKGRKYTDELSTDILQATAKKIGGRWVMFEWDDQVFSRSAFNKEEMIEAFKWVDGYINVTDFIKRGK